ncbi:MAG: PIN domain-containing protein [Nanoarchaeota archaeon]
MTDSYVFDTYALIEMFGGNKSYLKYENSKVIITSFILAELCYNLIKTHGTKISYEYVDLYSKFVQNIDKEVIKEAMKFRYLNVKKKMSTTDCIGYILAKKLDIRFLTGDKEFKDLPNVEFVK